MPGREPEPCRVASCCFPLSGVGLDSRQSLTLAWWLLAWLMGRGLCHSPSSWCPLAGWAAAPQRFVALQLQRVILLVTILILITGKCPHTQTQQLCSAVTQPRGETGHFSGAAGENSQSSMGRKSWCLLEFLAGGRGCQHPSGCQLFLPSVLPAAIIILTNKNPANCLLQVFACYQLIHEDFRTSPALRFICLCCQVPATVPGAL